MNGQTLLLRQVHPNFLPEGILSSQAFYPFPKDHGRLSVYDGDQISAEASYCHYTDDLGNPSAGVWGVKCDEVTHAGLASQPDPIIPASPAHAYINFGQRADKECRKLAKKLKEFAIARGCLHTP
ncbi:MAG: hypothetical protein HYZ17_03065 [Betaproteobacteria bacterium]|nr:hypothetical protein [Betaproteobacteria bacterium]